MPAIDVNDLTFGVEIETVMPLGVIRVGGYHVGLSIPGLPEGWKAEHDCSISSPPGHQACEIVSPVLKGADGIRQIQQVCQWLQSVGAKVNRSTGFHVHIGWIGDEAALKRLVSYVSNFEKALYATTGTKSREQGRFCQGVRQDTTYTDLYRDSSRQGLPFDRYRLLNLTNLRPGGRGTIEFRVFSGTINATKALGYVRLCLGLVEKALTSTRPPKWTPTAPVTTSPYHRKGGEGQTELTRLFYGIGWTKGDQPRAFGDIQPEGTPTIEATKEELMRLAAKYDGGEQDNSEGIEPGPIWASWTAETFAQWERLLNPRETIRVRLADGTDCHGTFLRRYPRNLSVRVSHLDRPILVPRINNPARSLTNGAFPR